MAVFHGTLGRMRNVSGKSSTEFKTWILRSITYPKNRAVYKITWEKYETPPGHRGQYGTCALYAG